MKKNDPSQVMLKKDRMKKRLETFEFYKKWPFCDMKVGDISMVNDKNQWKKAQRAAHAITGNDQWAGGKIVRKFRSRWDKKSSSGMISRIS